MGSASPVILLNKTTRQRLRQPKAKQFLRRAKTRRGGYFGTGLLGQHKEWETIQHYSPGESHLEVAHYPRTEDTSREADACDEIEIGSFSPSSHKGTLARDTSSVSQGISRVTPHCSRTLLVPEPGFLWHDRGQEGSQGMHGQQLHSNKLLQVSWS